MKRKLKSKQNPSNADTPSEYQYDPVKSPRDLRTCTRSDSVEFAGTYSIKILYQLAKFIGFEIYHNTFFVDLDMRGCNFTWLQLFPRNSFTAIAFWAYIRGENQ